MEKASPDGTKSAKRVVIRIDPVLDIKGPNEVPYNFDDHARSERRPSDPPKSALKSKGRQSIGVSPSPTFKQINVSHSPDDNEITRPYHRQRTDIESVTEEEENIPEHHRVLYDLLGADKAESILNPKIEEPAKATEVEAEQDQVRRLPAVDSGLGADSLWEILKKESNRKLYKMDTKIPVEWKTSYGAYVRNNINQNQSLVERSFTHHADVPELDKLLDQRYKERVQKARHHANVMYRSSENNKNRTTLLLSNNPVPDYNDREGRESLARYFSESLGAFDSKPTGKFLRLAAPISPTSPRSSLAVNGNIETHVSTRNPVCVSARSLVSANLLPIRKSFDHLHYLTEDGARAKGRFYGKYATADNVKMVTDIPGYRVQLPPSMKERVVVTAPVHDPSSFRPLDGGRRVFTPRPPIKRNPTWQPLTVGALMEYASIKYVLGQGSFRHGQTARWRTSAIATA